MVKGGPRKKGYPNLTHRITPLELVHMCSVSMSMYQVMYTVCFFKRRGSKDKLHLT